MFASIHPRWAIAFGNAWSKSSRKSHSEYDLIDKGEEELQFKYCNEILKTKDIDYFILGHRHLNKEYILEKEKKLIILSDWINESGYALWCGEDLKLKSFE